MDESKIFKLIILGCAIAVMIGLVGLFLLSFFIIGNFDNASFQVINKAGEDIQVTAYSNDYDIPAGKLSEGGPIFIPFYPARYNEILIPNDGRVSFRYVFSDQSLKYFLLKNKKGELCKIVVNTRGGCCYPPGGMPLSNQTEQTKFIISKNQDQFQITVNYPTKYSNSDKPETYSCD